MAVMIQIEYLWVVTQCSVLVGYQSFRTQYYLNFKLMIASQPRRFQIYIFFIVITLYIYQCIYSS